MTESLIREISSQLSRIFRYLLPGLVILGIARLFHPCWFLGRLQVSNGWQAAAISAVTITVGSVWYALHRYSVHQLLDVACYALRQHSVSGYKSWLYEQIFESFRLREQGPGAFEHAHLRSAQVILLFILDEALLVFAILLPPDCGGLLADHLWWRILLCFALFVICLWQFWISNGLDIDLVNRIKSNSDRSDDAFVHP